MNKSNLNINPLVSEIAGLFPCGKNSTYKSPDITCRLINSALENQSLEAMYKLEGNFSADRMLNKLHEISKEQTENLMDNSNQKLKLPKRVNLAIDFHNKKFYGNKNHFEIMGSKGGKYVKKYIEASLTNPKYFISAYPVNQITNNKIKLIDKILDGFYEKYDSKIHLILIDREFFSKKVVEYFCSNNLKFIMPAKKDSAIKKLVEQFKLGKIKNKVRYKFGECFVNLLFLKVEEEVYVFMTNTKYSPLKAALLYKKRWQIETNFREQNNFLFKTKTLNFAIRYFAFVLAGLLFNLWQMSRNGKIESYLFKKKLKDIILVEFSELIIFCKGIG
ncbi:MAG: transposase [Nanoarchaeota archaeon]|nr:transposase [Nanoarchaeota archaeon]